MARVAGWGRLDFAGTAVAPGTTAEIHLGVSEFYTAEPIAVPVTVVRGRLPGPTLFLTATIHGDELNGVGVIRDLLNDHPFDDLAGTLVAVPVANVPAFLTLDRRLPDRRDLNRAFPGSAKGSLTSRLAHTLFREVVLRSDFGIDLHTAGGERSAYPQVRVDVDDPRALALARAFGCPLLVAGKGPERSLRRSAVAAGVPTIVFEAGSARRHERPFIRLGADGVLNVLRHLRMLPGEPTPAPVAILVRHSRWLRARVGGILDLRAELGQPLGRDQEISVNTNPFGRERNVLRAPHAGVVLGLTQLPVVHPGDAVCHFAPLGRAEMAAWRKFWARAREGPARASIRRSTD
jgi:predicted deacylase